MEKQGAYGFGKTISGGFEQTVQRVREALQGQGFGILSEIDVQAKLNEKLGVDFRPYLILGACNPRFAFEALTYERDLGLLLPCNVIVYAEEGGGTTIMAMDPVKALGIVENPSVAPVAQQVRQLLERALEGI